MLKPFFATQISEYLHAQKCVSAVHEHSLTPEGLGYCPPIHFKKARQVDGSTALTGLNLVPVLVPAPGALSTHFVRTKIPLLGAV